MKAFGREEGYAALAALLAASCFALVAAQIARTSRSGIVAVNASATHARLVAGADAAVATALDHVLADDPAAAWQIDGRSYAEPIGALSASMAVEDERAKAPLNSISAAQARTLFQLAGATQSQAETLSTALIHRRDPSEEDATARPAGAAEGRKGGADLQSIEELRLLPGMTPEIFEALAHAVTIYPGVGFDSRFASPMAQQVMGGSPAAGYAQIVKNREGAGQQAAFSTPASLTLPGRVLTVRVEVSDDQGDRVGQVTVVELTGRPDRPYLVRSRQG